MHIGIDPGWKNLGFAVLDGRKLIESAVINPSLTRLSRTVESLSCSEWVPEVVSMERYVAYKGIMNAASEYILMIIGGLVYRFETQNVPIKLYRAIEWKPSLCKYLVKNYGFNNPSTSFDKKFSIAAAECIINEKIKSDHIADAVCLAYYGSIDNGEKT